MLRLDPTMKKKISNWWEISLLIRDIVGVVQFEDELGDIYFEIHPDFTHLKSDMLKYAENHLYAKLGNGRRYVRAFINQN